MQHAGVEASYQFLDISYLASSQFADSLLGNASSVDCLGFS